jgi:AcrR family transcriptional regulator
MLIAAGVRLFGREGYAATSIDMVAAEAGVTKGAAYHHFGGKVALFRAVFVHQQEELASALRRVAGGAGDSWSALREGCLEFLRQCVDRQVRQIVLLDGPAVLGWDDVRAIEYQHTLLLLRRGMSAAAADGAIDGGDLDIRCQVVFGALCEAGMLLARVTDPGAALPSVAGEVGRILDSLVLGQCAATG